MFGLWLHVECLNGSPYLPAARARSSRVFPCIKLANSAESCRRSASAIRLLSSCSRERRLFLLPQAPQSRFPAAPAVSSPASCIRISASRARSDPPAAVKADRLESAVSRASTSASRPSPSCSRSAASTRCASRTGSNTPSLPSRVETGAPVSISAGRGQCAHQNALGRSGRRLPRC